MNKRIFLIRSGFTKFGGAENYLLRLSRALSKKKIDHQIIHSYFPRFLPSWLKVVLFNLQVLLTKKNRFYFSLDRITCPDIYRAGDGVHKVFLSIEKKSRLNLLHSVYLYLEKKCFQNAKQIIANSKMVKKQILDCYSVDSKKINVVYNGVESKVLNYEKSFSKISKEFEILKNEFIILYVGSGFKRKGVEEFLYIISKLKTKKIKAFVIGKDKNTEYYINLAISLNINKKVFFTGPRVDVDDFYSISDIFLFPTHYDPFSNVVLEAMAFQNAVFTTYQNGASEILDSSFIMKNPKDYEIFSKIDALLENKESLASVKERNKNTSLIFSTQKNLDETLQVINKIEQ